MLATYMRRMRNNNLEIRIAGPLVARKNFGGTTVSIIEITLDIQSKPPESEHQDLVVAY